MTADYLIDIEQLEAGIWKVVDNPRANSNLASNEYFMSILGLIFLRHATNRYYAVMSTIDEDKATGIMPDHPLARAAPARARTARFVRTDRGAGRGRSAGSRQAAGARSS